MRHQHDGLDLFQRIEAQPRGAIAVGREAEPVHAAVHLQEDAVRPVGLERGEAIDLARLVNDVPQVQARAGLEIASVEAAFEEKDRAAPAEVAQQLGLGDVEQREAVGALQRRKCVGDAVAVGIGLDHRPDARAGRGLARDLEIGGKGVAMNDRFDRPRHGGILPAVCHDTRLEGADPENPRAINPAAGRQSGVSSDVR
jgi:hypothetical protein